MATQKEMRAKSQSEVFATLAQIIRTADVTPRMRRITLGGEGLAPLLAGTRLPADAIKLYLPPPGKPGFMPEFRVLPSEENPFSIRAYTIRRFDREALELDIDIVLHGDSPGSVWAWSVQPGDQVGFVGPRHDYLGVEDADWLLLAGDETAQPAISAIIESLPAGKQAFVFLEVIDAADEIALQTQADVTVTWLHRGDAQAGKCNLLEQAIRGFAWQEGTPYVWVAGETSVVRGIRRYLLNERGMDKARLHISGYWRYGLNNREFDMMTVKEYEAARAAGKSIEDHHDVDQVELDPV